MSIRFLTETEVSERTHISLGTLRRWRLENKGPHYHKFGWLVHYFTAWRHGSIRSRIVHLQELTVDPIRSKRFDRRMVVLRVMLLIGFLASAAWAVETYHPS